MNWFQNVRKKMKEQLIVVASDPENFQEKWRFSSNRIQIFSLGIIAFIIGGMLFSLLIYWSPFSSFVSHCSFAQ